MKNETVKQHAERIDLMIEVYRKRMAENRWGLVNAILEKHQNIFNEYKKNKHIV